MVGQVSQTLLVGRLRGPALQQGDDGLGDLVRMRRAARQIEVHLDLFVQGVGAVQQGRQRRIIGIGVGIGGLAAPVIALEEILVMEAVDQGRDAAVGGAGPQGDDHLAALAHGLGHLQVLLVADAAADQAHHRRRNIQVMDIAVAGLPEIFMVHEDRDMNKFQLGQDRKQGLAQVQDGNLTA